MKEISRPVRKVDSTEKTGGYARYVDDYTMNDLGLKEIYFGKIVRSTIAHGRIQDIHIPDLPKHYHIIDKNDCPVKNSVHVGAGDMPIFADDKVEFIGDPILMIVGPDKKILKELAKQIVIDYEELEPILDPEQSQVAFYEYQYKKGNVDKAFQEADFVFEEKLYTGYQEQAYLEPQGLIAWEENGKMNVRGSLQCPYYVKEAVKTALGFDDQHVRIIQDTMGGGFGGKEDHPSMLGTYLAVAAHKVKKPIKIIFDRKEDILATSKKHPSVNRYKIAVKDHKITAMDIDVIYNSGAYTTLSSVVLQRGIISAPGVYRCDHLKVHGICAKTNTVPNGAYRGFGASQTFFAVETMMNHIAYRIGMDPLEWKLSNLAKKEDRTSTNGIYHWDVPVKEMVQEVDLMADYRRKKEKYKCQAGRFRKGIGISLSFHGAGFTGAGERDIIKAVTRLRKYADGRVEILAANTDMGQGIKTAFAKIVGRELNIPYQDIIYHNPDTDFVPDSGPTVASRSCMVVGELLRRCAIQLREQWVDGEEQWIEQRYQEPDFMIPFDLQTFQGDAYPSFAWSVHCVELEIDMLTGQHHVLGTYGSFDVGTPIDQKIVEGQMEGGMLQGIGYSHMEHMTSDRKGFIRNNTFTDYIMPTTMDVPEMKVHLHVQDFPNGPYGAKGAGELPAVGGAAAYLEAVEQALGQVHHHIPFTTEDTMRAWMNKSHEKIQYKEVTFHG